LKQAQECEITLMIDFGHSSLHEFLIFWLATWVRWLEDNCCFPHYRVSSHILNNMIDYFLPIILNAMRSCENDVILQ